MIVSDVSARLNFCLFCAKHKAVRLEYYECKTNKICLNQFYVSMYNHRSTYFGLTTINFCTSMI